MQGSKQDIEIDQKITYSLVSETFSSSLKLHNKSANYYVFKIKTNQRSVVSMQLTHDFIKPNSIKEITMKLAEKPSESTSLKLEINYAIPSEEEIRVNDSKMNSYGRDSVFRKIITVNRDDSINPMISSLTSPTKKKQEVFNHPSNILSSSLTQAIEIKNEPIKQQKKQIIKQQIKKDEIPKIQQKVQKVEKVDQVQRVQKVEKTKISYPQIIKVQSEQINILSGKSGQINIAQLINQSSKSSQDAIKKYQKPINIGNNFKQDLIKQVPMPISISNSQDKFQYSQARSSPTHKKISSNSQFEKINPASYQNKPIIKHQNSQNKNSNEILKEWIEKINKQKSTISKLKIEQADTIRGDCVYPIPIIYAIVFLVFLSGSFTNWILA